MKNIFHSLAFLTVVSLLFIACDKVEDLPVYNEGVTPVLSSSTASVAPTPADSLSTVATLSWTSPAFATDSANYKFIVSVDTTDSFTHPYTKTVTGVLSAGFTAKELNNILFSYGYTFNVPHDLYMQVLASYGNNNEPHTTNTVKLTATAYKVPPKIEAPASGKLFMVGDATQTGWDNPASNPTQELLRIDETTWGGIMNINAGKEYLILPVSGNWDHKYSVTPNPAPIEAGDFGYDLPNNFKGPATAGWYKMICDFQLGKYAVTSADAPFTGAAPADLYIIGDATPGGWDNPVPAAQKFTQVSSTLFELTITLNGGKQYLLLPENGSWDHKFGGTDKTFSGILADNDVPGSNTPAPDVTASYKIVVNFANHSYAVTKQ